MTAKDTGVGSPAIARPSERVARPPGVDGEFWAIVSIDTHPAERVNGLTTNEGGDGMERRFEGKVVVVTGAGGGIGRAAAARFAAEGAKLVLVDLGGPALENASAGVAGAGAEAIAVSADVTQIADVERYRAAAVERFGGIDCLFNNAGVLGVVSPMVDYPEEVFDRVFAVNVKGVWLGMKVVGPVIAARGGGAIVNTASIAGLRGTPNLVAYTASKHAVIGLTRTA
jgi:NAD(P)-dependent dehydrogenase (short-subunit alcohol dehydrogenase family)